MAHVAQLRVGVVGFAQLGVVAADGIGYQHFNGLAQQLGRSVAKQLTGLRIGRHHAARLVADDDAQRGVGKHGLEAAYAVGQGALGLLQAAALSKVDQQQGPAGHLAVGQPHIGPKRLAHVAADIGFQVVVAFAPAELAHMMPLGGRPGQHTQRMVGVGEKGFFGRVGQQAHPGRVHVREPA